MRKIIAILAFIFVFTDIHCQDLDGYKYVIVQTLTYQYGGTDKWNISENLREEFSNSGFIVYSESVFLNPKILPIEFINNPCLGLSCYINHTNVTVGTNKVTITLKDCNNNLILTSTGSAAGWSVQDDFNKATRRAYNKIRYLNYNFNPKKVITFNYPEVDKINESEESLKEYYYVNSLDKIEGIYKSYQQDKRSTYYKIGIKKHADKYIAIIIESELERWKPGEIIGYFESTATDDIYSIEWYGGNKKSVETFAVIEDGAILAIEITDRYTGKKKLSKFIKLYPDIKADTPNDKLQKSSGSGFLITTDGIIATNAHVVKDAEKIKIKISNEIGDFEYFARILLIDNINDVALLKIDDDEFTKLSQIPFSLIEYADIGEKAFTIGYPLNSIMGTNYKVTDGLISSVTGINDDIRYYQISVPLQPGNSGGPLFNSNGDVVGITSAKLNSHAVGTEIENVNYAIKISYVINLYNMLPIAEELNSTPSKTTKELKELVKANKNYVCLIEVN